MRTNLLAGCSLLAALAGAALLAPAIARDPNAQTDPPAARLLPPGSLRYELRLADGRELLAERVARDGDRLRATRLGEEISFTTSELAGLTADGLPPRRRFLLGTDELGRDVWARWAHAGRRSLAIGLLATALAVSLGVGVGALAGVAGGWADGMLMRGVDALLAFPRLFLVIALAALVESSATAIVLVLGLTGWMGAARLTRSEVRALRAREFVLAAHGMGQPPLAVVTRHLLPNALTPVMIDTALRVGDIILVEAALSYLGLGVQPPNATWGNMISEGAAALPDAWWISTPAGMAIAATVLGLNLIADGLRDRRDPRRRRA